MPPKGTTSWDQRVACDNTWSKHGAVTIRSMSYFWVSAIIYLVNPTTRNLFPKNPYAGRFLDNFRANKGFHFPRPPSNCIGSSLSKIRYMYTSLFAWALSAVIRHSFHVTPSEQKDGIPTQKFLTHGPLQMQHLPVFSQKLAPDSYRHPLLL